MLFEVAGRLPLCSSLSAVFDHSSGLVHRYAVSSRVFRKLVDNSKYLQTTEE